MANHKVQTSFYIDGEIRGLVRFLANREEITKTVFYKRALNLFFEGDREIDPKILITERTHRDYIRRGALETIQLEPEHKRAVEQAAHVKGCTEGQVIFMALLKYCGALLREDSTGVSF